MARGQALSEIPIASAVARRPLWGVLSLALTVLGGCGQDNVVGLSRTHFLADVGFKLRERDARLRQKIFP